MEYLEANVYVESAIITFTTPWNMYTGTITFPNYETAARLRFLSAIWQINLQTKNQNEKAMCTFLHR